MKIVYLSNASVPSRSAQSVHIMKMCQAFVRNGHSIELITAGKRTERLDPPGSSGILRAEPVCPESAGPESGSANEALSPWSEYGVEAVFPIYRVRWWSRLPGKSWLFAWISARKARKLRPDVIYGRNLLAVDAATRAGARTAFESHSPEFARGPAQMKMARNLVESPNCLRIVVISDALKRAWLEAIPSAAPKLLVARDGADLPNPAHERPPRQNESPHDVHKTSREHPAPKALSVEEDTGQAGSTRITGPVVVGYLGQLYPGKGMELLDRIIPNCPELKFRIVGGDPDAVAHWRERLKTLQNVEFYGHVPHEEVSKQLAGMDIVVAPYSKTVTPRKGGPEIGRWMSPLKIFEYMAAGKPIVASDLPVIRELLEDGKEALLADADDPETWTEALRTLAGDPVLREHLGRAARQKLATNYTWRQRARNIAESLQEGLPGKSDHLTAGDTAPAHGEGVRNADFGPSDSQGSRRKPSDGGRP
ncbi:MAG: glycosyltransferase family 4 protein [Balneolaceae bacterium]